MVYCRLVAIYPNAIDAIETRVTDIGSGNSNEVRRLTSWGHWLWNDVNSVTAVQSYSAAPGHQNRKRSSGGTMVYKMQNIWTP